MELWIRSQSKELLMKSPELRYNRKDNNHSILAYDTLGVYRILGTYETKERAIEVLDEIQYKIKNMYILENCKLPKDSCIEQSLAMDDFNIYEMPEN